VNFSIKQQSLILAFVLLAGLTVFPPTQTAYAEINPNLGYVLDSPYGNTYLTSDGWCGTYDAWKIKNLNGTDSGRGTQSWDYDLANCDDGSGVATGFNATTYSYAIFKARCDSSMSPFQDLGDCVNPNYTPTNGQPQKYTRNAYYIFYSDTSEGKLTFYKDANGVYRVTSTKKYHVGFINAEDNTLADFKYIHRTPYQYGQYGAHPNRFTVDPTSAAQANHPGFVTMNDTFSAQVVAKNVIYSSTWDLNQFNQNLAIYSNEDKGCSALDIACAISKFTGSITSGLSNLLIALFNGLSKVFVPDSARISASMTDLKSHVETKMGFLAFPIQFTIGVLNAFTTPATWCSDQSCSKNFGQFLHGPLTINFLALKNIAPSYWTWVLTFIRGITILGLIFMFKYKYEGIMRK
jgi:hypothetical protein